MMHPHFVTRFSHTCLRVEILVQLAERVTNLLRFLLFLDEDSNTENESSSLAEYPPVTQAGRDYTFKYRPKENPTPSSWNILVVRILCHVNVAYLANLFKYILSS